MPLARVALSLAGLFVPFWGIAGELMYPPPKGAETPAHVVLLPGVAEQDYFWVSERYPGFSALSHYRAALSSWKECSGPNKEWAAYADVSNGDGRFVHTRSNYWVSENNDAYVIVLAKYESRGTAWRNRPENDRQFVAVIKYTVQNAREMLAKTNVPCNPGT